MQETKKITFVQVVALAKGNLEKNVGSFEGNCFLGPCMDDEILFQCPNVYTNSCIDEKLRCNGRSECPNGGDERDCHRMY
jgi:hypothetical protein